MHACVTFAPNPCLTATLTATQCVYCPQGTAQEIACFHRLPDLVGKGQAMVFPSLPQTEPYGGLSTPMVAKASTALGARAICRVAVGPVVCKPLSAFTGRVHQAGVSSIDVYTV